MTSKPAAHLTSRSFIGTELCLLNPAGANPATLDRAAVDWSEAFDELAVYVAKQN